MINYWIEKGNRNLLQFTGGAVALSLLFTTLASPFAQASLWEDRAKSVETFKKQQQPVQLASANFGDLSAQGAMPLNPQRMTGDLSGLSDLLSGENPANEQAVREILARRQAREANRIKNGVPAWLWDRLSGYGEVERVYSPQGNQISLVDGKIRAQSPVIIHIQDVHGVYGVQKNLASLLQELMDLGVATIGVEGANDDLPALRTWRKFPSRTAMVDVAGAFLREGIVTGAEMAGLATEREGVEFVGLEQKEEYLEQVRSFTGTLDKNRAAKQWEAGAEKVLTDLKDKIYGEDLKALDLKKTAFENRTLQLGDWIDFLAHFNPQASALTDLSRYPNASKYLKTYALEKEIDFSKVGADQKALLEGLSRKLNKEELTELLQDSLLYRLGKMGYSEFYGNLSSKCRKAGLTLTPGMRRYMEYVTEVEGISHQNLFDELAKLEAEAWKKGRGGKDAQELVRMDADYRLLKRGLDFELGPQEWAQYGAREKDLLDLDGRIDRLAAKLAWVGPARASLKSLVGEETLRKISRFNELSLVRSRIFVRKLSERMKEKHANVAVLIAGGFHSAGLEKLLKEKNVGFITLKPKINLGEVKDGYNSLSAFTRDPLPLEKLFLPEKVTINHPLLSTALNALLNPTQALADGAALETLSAAEGLDLANPQDRNRFMADLQAYFARQGESIRLFAPRVDGAGVFHVFARLGNGSKVEIVVEPAGSASAAADGASLQTARRVFHVVQPKWRIYLTRGFWLSLFSRRSSGSAQASGIRQSDTFNDHFSAGIDAATIDAAMTQLRAGLTQYLDGEVRQGKFDESRARGIFETTIKSVEQWLRDEHIDIYTKRGILKAIFNGRWGDIATAHSSKVKFGTAGPRQVAALTIDELKELEAKGFQAEILKGPNTINNITLSLLTLGVARYYLERRPDSTNPPSVAITYDSRVYGKAFADLVAAIFISQGFRVYLFSESSPMPLMSFSVAALKLDLGILISASHNPALYNGYKVSNEMGAQLDPATRKGVEDHIYGNAQSGIDPMTFGDIRDFIGASVGLADPQAVYHIPSGSDQLGPLVERFARNQPPSHIVVLESREIKSDRQGRRHINLLGMHEEHVMELVLMNPRGLRRWAGQLRVLYAAFYGVGYNVFSRLARRIGLTSPVVAQSVAKLNGLFPLFTGRTVQGTPDPIIPDPGNSAGHAFSWEIILQELVKQFGGDVQAALRGLFLFAGTDPDADRLGVGPVIPLEELPEGMGELETISTKNVPPDQVARVAQMIAYVVPAALRAKVGFAALRLLSANDTWALILKYRIDRLAEMMKAGQIPQGLKFTIVKTHVTTDAISALAAYGRSLGLDIEIIEPYVGFSLVAEVIQQGWREGKINLGGAEESGGFSIGGAPPVFFALMHLFEKYADYRVTIRQDGSIDTNHPEPLLTLALQNGRSGRSYFGYSSEEIRQALEYLAAQGVLIMRDGHYVLSADYRHHQESGDYWGASDRLVVGAPGDRLGKRGHTLEKDGLMALVLVIEMAAYAKSQGMTFDQYLQRSLYLNPLVGYYSTTNQSMEFPNTIGGQADKVRAIRNSLGLARRFRNGEQIIINGQRVTSVEIFVPPAPKYADPANFPVTDFGDLIPLLNDENLRANPGLLKSFFPEEGVRFHFSDGSHLTIRPSGTENKLRFYVQWKAEQLTQETLVGGMLAADKMAYEIAIDAQRMLREPSSTSGAPADSIAYWAARALWGNARPEVAARIGIVGLFIEIPALMALGYLLSPIAMLAGLVAFTALHVVLEVAAARRSGEALPRFTQVIAQFAIFLPYLALSFGFHQHWDVIILGLLALEAVAMQAVHDLRYFGRRETRVLKARAWSAIQEGIMAVGDDEPLETALLDRIGKLNGALTREQRAEAVRIFTVLRLTLSPQDEAKAGKADRILEALLALAPAVQGGQLEDSFAVHLKRVVPRDSARADVIGLVLRLPKGMSDPDRDGLLRAVGESSALAGSAFAINLDMARSPDARQAVKNLALKLSLFSPAQIENRVIFISDADGEEHGRLLNGLMAQLQAVQFDDGMALDPDIVQALRRAFNLRGVLEDGVVDQKINLGAVFGKAQALLSAQGRTTLVVFTANPQADLSFEGLSQEQRERIAYVNLLTGLFETPVQGLSTLTDELFKELKAIATAA